MLSIAKSAFYIDPWAGVPALLPAQNLLLKLHKTFDYSACKVWVCPIFTLNNAIFIGFYCVLSSICATVLAPNFGNSAAGKPLFCRLLSDT